MKLNLIFMFTMIPFYNDVRAGITSHLDLNKCRHDKELDLDVSKMKIYLYDFDKNVNISGTIGDVTEIIIKYLNFDTSRPLAVYVPGYTAYVGDKIVQKTWEALKYIPETYLLYVDYSIYAIPFTLNNYTNYYTTVEYAYYIGKAVGKLLSEIHDNGYPSNRIRGFANSFGGQIMGYVGETYLNTTSEKMWRLSAIEAAGPCFTNSSLENQIRSGLAEYVEVYHCTEIATTSELADVDFYYNPELETQPGCEDDPEDIETKMCSHMMCFIHWLKTVNTQTSYVACNSYEDYINTRCSRSDVTIAGYYNPAHAKGVFYASTVIDP